MRFNPYACSSHSEFLYFMRWTTGGEKITKNAVALDKMSKKIVLNCYNFW